MKPGIYTFSMAEYLADPCDVPSLNSGTAFRMINESPNLAWHQHPKLGGHASAPSDAADTGSTAHDLLLGGEGKICEIDPALYPAKTTGEIPKGWTNAAIREARDDAREKGLIPMLKPDLLGVRAMVKVAREFVADSEIASVFEAGAGEQTVIGREGDVLLRTRPDWLNLRAGVSLSYKTTKASVAPARFKRISESQGYFFALEFYRRALKSAGHAGVRHVILAQEQDFPYACSLIELSPAKAELVRLDVERAINLWRQCLKEDRWPGYGGRVHVIEPEPWELIGETEIEYA